MEYVGKGFIRLATRDLNLEKKRMETGESGKEEQTEDAQRTIESTVSEKLENCQRVKRALKSFK